MTPPQAPSRVVITDANIQINFIHANLLALLGDLPPYCFVVRDQVLAEITRPEQRAAVGEAITAGDLAVMSVSSLEALHLFAELPQ